MSLVRYNTNYDDFLPSTFNVFVNRFFNDQQIKNTGDNVKFLPNVGVIEKENAFELHVALPGLKKENVELHIADNVLTLKGERKLENEKKEGRYCSFETQYGTFKRGFKLPKNVDQTKVDASFEDGILKINLFKIDEKELKTTINIK